MNNKITVSTTLNSIIKLITGVDIEHLDPNDLSDISGFKCDKIKSYNSTSFRRYYFLIIANPKKKIEATAEKVQDKTDTYRISFSFEGYDVSYLFDFSWHQQENIRLFMKIFGNDEI